MLATYACIPFAFASALHFLVYAPIPGNFAEDHMKTGTMYYWQIEIYGANIYLTIICIHVMSNCLKSTLNI